MHRESWITEELQRLESTSLTRHTRVMEAAGGKITLAGKPVLNFASNDYLDLASHPGVKEKAAACLAEYGAGATASRLVSGTLPCHAELEEKLASHKGYPACLLFGSGFLTNCGVIPNLVGRNDRVLADKLVHASMLDAIRLSGARLQRFQHNDVDHLAALLGKEHQPGRSLVLTESVFSMDGDLAPLPAMAELAEQYGALFMVDEAHASGVFGPAGAGLIARHSLQSTVNVSMGTLSKAFGGYGGFVTCSRPMRELLVNRARSFIYTTALPPPSVGAALGALEVLERNPNLGEELLSRADLFRRQLRAGGLDCRDSASQIIPVVIGGNAEALSAAAQLQERGIFVVAIRPPTVPDGTARIRLSITCAHREDDLERAAEAVIEVVHSLSA